MVISVRAYEKNLSIARLRSHYDFSKKIKNCLEDIKPYLIHALIPPNTLVKALSEYKQKYMKTTLIFDLIDLWPETMPIEQFKGLPPFILWKNYRDKYLDMADIIFTECDLYQEVLQTEDNSKFSTLHWARKEKVLEGNYKLEEDKLSFCYLGSINNIIDIDLIIKFLRACKMHKPVSIHIIGNGEGKESFIDQLKRNNIVVYDHGEVYSQKEKQNIFDQCNYGLNIMKKSVVVGLTMKSLDYMCGQLPLINTIQGDTKELCSKYNLGFTIDESNYDDISLKVSSETIEENFRRRECIKDIYNTIFTKDSFFSKLETRLSKYV